MKFNERREMIYNFIEKYYADNGLPPTVREIANGVGLSSPGTVKMHLDKLVESGRLVCEQNKSRSFKPACFVSSTQVPIVGNVAAGRPILALENRTGSVSFYNIAGYNEKELFALMIKGESMKNAGILNGDIVIVHSTPVAYNGEIVIALIDDEATCKRFYYKDGEIILHPENTAFSDIITDKAIILGKVVSVIRYY